MQVNLKDQNFRNEYNKQRDLLSPFPDADADFIALEHAIDIVYGTNVNTDTEVTE